jgi:iron(III) transport system permease protein
MIPRAGGTPLVWPILGFIGSLVVLVPVAIVLASVFQSSGGEWSHLAETRLPAYVGNTLVLAVSVCTFAGVIGVASAWLVTMHRFPGRRVLS